MVEGITLLLMLSSFLTEPSVVESNDDWFLVFKGVTGGDGSIYDLFLSDTTRNSYVLEAQVLNNTYPGHYKSDILNYWDHMDITQVKVGVYRGSEQKAFFTFNAIGADRTAWFGRNRLTNTSYHDLLDPLIPTNYFSMKGDVLLGSESNQLMRRFFVNSFYDGCHTDEGWFLVKDVDAPGVCDWETDYGQETPTILFSPHSNRSQFDNDRGNLKADFMTISVQFGYNSLFNDYSAFGTRCSQQDDSTTAASTSSTSSATTTTTTTTTTTNPTTTTTASPTEQPIDMATLTKQMDETKERLFVPRNSTSAHKRSKISAPDYRQSAKNIGVIGIVLLLVVGLLIVVPDAARLAVALHGTCVRRRTVDIVQAET